MAWVAPSTRSTGELITSAVWNQDVVSNTIAIKEGDVARDKETLDGQGTPPAVSPSGDARFFYDSSTDELKFSRNGAAYEHFGGKLIQIVTGETLTEDTTTAGFDDTSLTATITAQSLDSTILVACMHNGIGKSTADVRGDVKLVRITTTLQTFMVAGNPSADGNTSAGTVFTETSTATAAREYHTQFRRNAGTGNFTLQTGGDYRSWILVMELGSGV